MNADTARAADPLGWPDAFAVAEVHARPLADGDADLFVTLYGDPATMRHVGPVLDPQAAARAFAAAQRQMQLHPPLARYWRIETGSGECGLLSLVPDADRRAAETGVLLPPAVQGQGIATAMLGRLRDALFGAGALDILWTRHRSGHAAAVGLMRRLGFVDAAPVQGWQRWHLERDTWRGLVDRPLADWIQRTGER